MVINLLELFDLSVTKNGDKIAIVDGTRTISFNDLDKKSDILSQKIHNIAESVNRPVAVFLPKCIEAVKDIGRTSTLYDEIHLQVDQITLRYSSVQDQDLRY